MHKECPSRGAGCPKDRRREETGRKCAWSGYNFQQCGRFHTDLSALATPDEQSVDSLAVVGAGRLWRQIDTGLEKAAGGAGRRKSGRKMTAGVEIYCGCGKIRQLTEEGGRRGKKSLTCGTAPSGEREKSVARSPELPPLPSLVSVWIDEVSCPESFESESDLARDSFAGRLPCTVLSPDLLPPPLL